LESLETRLLPAHIVDLGPLSGTFANVTGVNSTAEVVGQTLNPSSNEYQGFLIDSNGVQHNVGPLTGFTESFASGLNDAGEVVGFSQNAPEGINYPEEAFLDNHGTLTDLGTLGGNVSVATSVSASGQVVGYSTTTSGNYLLQDGFIWRPGVGMQDLGALTAGGSSGALAINDAGDVVGYSTTSVNETTPPSPTDAVLWSQGGPPQNLRTLPGGGSSEATGINASDQVVGYSTISMSANSPNHAFLWSQANGMQDLGTLTGYTDSYAAAINSSGEVVGYALDNAIGGLPSHAFIYNDGQMTDLNAYLPAGSNWVLSTATAINDQGVVIGMGYLNGVPSGYELFTTAGPATQLGVATGGGPPGSIGAGGTFSLTLDALDQYGDLAAGFNGSVTVSLLNSAGVSLQGKLTMNAVDGVVTFPGLSIDTVGSYTIEATSTGLMPAVTSVINVTAAAATQLVVVPGNPPATVTAGATFGFVVDAEDQYDNIDPTFGGTVTVALSGSPGVTLHGSLTAAAQSGIGTFSGLSIDQAGSSYTIEVTSGSLTPAQTAPITIHPASPFQLVFSAEPPESATAGTDFAPAPVIDVEDQFGNIETGDNVTVITAAPSGGSAQLQGNIANVSGGIATFSTLADTEAQTLTLQFTGGGLSPITSSAINVMPAVASNMIVRHPPSGIIAGVAFRLEVDALDPYDNLATSFNGPVTVSVATGPGTLSGTVTVTAQSGVATFTNLISDASGKITLGASAESGGSTISSPPSDPTVVGPAAAALLFVAKQPSDMATAGRPFATQPVIDEEDQFGNLETGDNSTVVTATLQSGSGPLLGTVAATVVGGVARFTGLSDNQAEEITLKFSSGSLEWAISTNIVVSPAAPSQLVMYRQPSVSAATGEPFGVQPAVALEDKYGNVETGDNSTVVTVSASAGNGPLLGTNTATVVGGVATFTNLADATSETITLEFQSDGVASVTSDPIIVSPGVSGNLVIHTQPSRIATAGQKFATQPVIYLVDANGNLQTGDNSAVVTASLASGIGPLQGTTSVTVKGGVATFTNLADDLAETVSLNFSVGGLMVGPSTDILVSPGAASHLVVHIQPSGTATAGKAFATQPVIYETDEFGNLETSDSTTVVTAVVAAGSAQLQGATATLTDGVATFTNLADDSARSLALEFTGGGLASLTSDAINVIAAAATQLVMVTQPAGAIAQGKAFGFQVAAEDPFHNIDLTFDGPVTVAIEKNPGSVLLGPRTITAESGIAEFAGLTVNQPGNGYTLKLSSGNLTSVTTKPFNVTGVAPIVSSEEVVPQYKPSKKQKRQGKPFAWAFVLQYSAPMSATAALKANYQIAAATTRHGQTTYTPVGFTASYDKAKNTITLTVSGTGPFAKGGGRITITASGASGVSSQTGALLNPKYATFTISSGAPRIALG
jgi:probable HAF family extracellular repeat protein